MGEDTYELGTQEFRESKQPLRSYAQAKRREVDEVRVFGGPEGADPVFVRCG